MIRTQTFNAVRLLLCLSLLGNCFGTPTYRHAHAGGETPHDHQAIDSHHDHCDDCCCDDHHDCEPDDVAIIYGSIPHEHTSWFGIRFVLPMQSGSTHPAESTSQAEFIGLQSVASVVATPSNVLIPLHVGWCRNDNVTMDFSQSLKRRLSVSPVVTAPLCDTARHERSGVQLA